MDDLTLLLNRASDGGRITADQLLPLVYEKLRQVAAEKMTHELEGQNNLPGKTIYQVIC